MTQNDDESGFEFEPDTDTNAETENNSPSSVEMRPEFAEQETYMPRSRRGFMGAAALAGTGALLTTSGSVLGQQGGKSKAGDNGTDTADGGNGKAKMGDNRSPGDGKSKAPGNGQNGNDGDGNGAGGDTDGGEVPGVESLGYAPLSDLQILKFALLLERLEATYYTQAVGSAPIGESGSDGVFTQEEIETSQPARQFTADSGLRDSTFDYLQRVRNHEQAHVGALESVVEGIGGDPNFAGDVEFEFPYENVQDFVSLAQVFEDTGAGAYSGAAPFIDEEQYLASAAQILAVEARHASYLRVLTVEDQVPFPQSFQERLSVSAVVSGIEPFVVGADAEDIVALLG